MSTTEGRESSASAIIDIVVRAAKTFADDAEQHDDMTMVVVKIR